MLHSFPVYFHEFEAEIVRHSYAMALAVVAFVAVGIALCALVSAPALRRSPTF